MKGKATSVPFITSSGERFRPVISFAPHSDLTSPPPLRLPLSSLALNLADVSLRGRDSGGGGGGSGGGGGGSGGSEVK